MEPIEKLKRIMCLHMVMGVLYFTLFVSMLIDSYVLFIITFFAIPLLWLIRGIKLTIEYFKIK